MYGINDSNRTDPMVQAAAVAAEHAKNNAVLTNALGREPTFADHYLAHQQGVTGASALLANPDMPAWKAVRPYYKSDAIAQSAITGNLPKDSPLKGLDVNDISSKGFTSYWGDKFNRGLPGGATASAALPAAQPPAFGAGAAPAQDFSAGLPPQMAGLGAGVPALGSFPTAAANVASMTGAGGAAPPDDAANKAKVEKILAAQKGDEQSAQSKQLMTLAQQLMTAGSQKPSFTPMQFGQVNTGPTRPLPLSIPKFGGLA
jgi:hypothetical protein